MREPIIMTFAALPVSLVERRRFGNRERRSVNVAITFMLYVFAIVSVSMTESVSATATLEGFLRSMEGTRPRMPTLWMKRVIDLLRVCGRKALRESCDVMSSL